MQRTLYVYEGQCGRHSWGGSATWKPWTWCARTRQCHSSQRKRRRRGWGRNQERRRRRLGLQDTLAQTVLMWSDHVSVSLMVTPRNLKERTCSTWLPSTLSSKVLPESKRVTPPRDILFVRPCLTCGSRIPSISVAQLGSYNIGQQDSGCYFSAHTCCMISCLYTPHTYTNS